MCGLFGAWGWPELNTTAALRALQSRGPDDQGEFVDPLGLTLLHTRLAIQDLSPLGHQPIITSDKGLVLVFNGEIYNFHELERELRPSSSSYTSDEEYTSDWPGLCGHVDAWHAKAADPGWVDVLEAVMKRRKCRACKGERLKPEWRAITIEGVRLPEVLSWDVAQGLSWISRVDRTTPQMLAVDPVTAELEGRLAVLDRTRPQVRPART